MQDQKNLVIAIVLSVVILLGFQMLFPGPPPEERNFVPAMHFVEISNDRLVYIGERGQNRIQVFTTDGEWQQDIYVSPETPAQRACGSVDFMPGPCGTMYKMVISIDPEQK